MLSRNALRTLKLAIFLTVFVVFSKASAQGQSCKDIFLKREVSFQQRTVRRSPFENLLHRMGLQLKGDIDIVPLPGVRQTDSVAITIQKIQEMTKMKFIVVDKTQPIDRREEIVGVGLERFEVPRSLIENEDMFLAELSDLQQKAVVLSRLLNLNIEVENVVITSQKLDFDVKTINDVSLASGLRYLKRLMLDYGLVLSFRETLTRGALGQANRQHIFLLNRFLFADKSVFLNAKGQQVLKHELIHVAHFIQHHYFNKLLISFRPFFGNKNENFPDGYLDYFRSDEVEAWTKSDPKDRYKEFLVQIEWLDMVYEQLQEKPVNIIDQYYSLNLGQNVVEIGLPEKNVVVVVQLSKTYKSTAEDNLELQRDVESSVYKRLQFLSLFKEAMSAKENSRLSGNEFSSDDQLGGGDEIPF